LGIALAKPVERPVRALRFQGFGLGIWNWPLINLLLSVRGFSTATSSPPKTIYANIEEYSIWEDKGGVIRVRVHRRAERS